MENPNEEESDRFSDHMLCGYLQAVLAIAPPHNSQTLFPINTRCHVSVSASSEIQFECGNGIVLLPIDLTPKKSGQCWNTALSPPSSSKKRWSRIGMVHGSLSVVRQLRVLFVNKCLRIIERVVGVSVHGDDAKVRVVVLVDVYLPIALWSRWQFLKAGKTGVALLKHLSCDWKTRLLLLSCSKPDLDDDCGI